MSAPPHKKVYVLLPVPFDQAFTYLVPEALEVEVGDFVQVPFGSRTLTGVVWSLEKEPEVRGQQEGVLTKARASYTLKSLLKRFSLPSLNHESRQFVEWVGRYYMAPLGLVLKMVMPEPSVFKDRKRDSSEEVQDSTSQQKIVLSEAQTKCVKFLKQKMDGFHTVLLEGVTGSGKTEVYLELIEEFSYQRKQSLVLLPEIALSAQWVRRFEDRFGEKPVLWHSDLTPAQRRKNWEVIVKGEARVVVGARSALFLPYQNLGLIVVDEEHEGGYKQESGVLYQARDMAVVRGSLAKCLVVLASATPSLETVVNVEQGRYGVCHLAHRYGVAQFPEVSLVDRRTKEGQLAPQSQWISTPLYQAMQEELTKGNQVLLFLNRRGYSPLLLCRECGERITCKQCDVWLVYHKYDHKLQCHHCGYSMIKPKQCGSCQSLDSFVPCGPGVERVMEEVQSLFPSAKTLMMTSDTMTSVKRSEEMLNQIENKEADIIVGTQVMAKGHHFPHLTVVGIIDGDLGLSGSDLRLVERTYQLLHQVSGRSGRAEKKGRVFIQSYMADHSVMKALVLQDPSLFLSLEKEARQLYGFPPYGRLAAVIISGRKAHEVEEAARKMAKLLPVVDEVDVLGPVAASMTKLKGQYRWRFLIKSSRHVKLQPFLKKWMALLKVPSTIRIQIDIDPYYFY